MLHNPNWDKQAKLTELESTEETLARVMTLGALIAWLELQPPHQTYSWLDPNLCLVAEYINGVTGTNTPVKWANGDYDRIFRPFDREADYERAYHKVGATKPWTFGGALKRARALVETTSE